MKFYALFSMKNILKLYQMFWNIYEDKGININTTAPLCIWKGFSLKPPNKCLFWYKLLAILFSTYSSWYMYIIKKQSIHK